MGNYLVYSSNTRQTPLWPGHEEIFQSVTAPTDRVASAHREKHIIPNTYASLNPFVILIKGNLFVASLHVSALDTALTLTDCSGLASRKSKSLLTPIICTCENQVVLCLWLSLQFFRIRYSKLVRASKWESWMKLLVSYSLVVSWQGFAAGWSQTQLNHAHPVKQTLEDVCTFAQLDDFVLILLPVWLHPWNRKQVPSLAFIHDQLASPWHASFKCRHVSSPLAGASFHAAYGCRVFDSWHSMLSSV